MNAAALHPRIALFESGERAPDLPVCDHYAGVPTRMAKSLQMQAELGPVFDITLDCEDGAPVGGEAEHADMVAELVASSQNLHGRVGVRVHPMEHPAFAHDVDTLMRRAGARLAYVMVPKVACFSEAGITPVRSTIRSPTMKTPSTTFRTTWGMAPKHCEHIRGGPLPWGHFMGVIVCKLRV